MSTPNVVCRGCGGKIRGWDGLCIQCADAVERFLITRRMNADRQREANRRSEQAGTGAGEPM